MNALHASIEALERVRIIDKMVGEIANSTAMSVPMRIQYPLLVVDTVVRKINGIKPEAGKGGAV